MEKNQYCEPCQRFLRGQISPTGQSHYWVDFVHHPTFQSFETAMQIPCALCSLAWIYNDKPPSAEEWQTISGCYKLSSHGHTLWFSAGPHHSAGIVFDRWPNRYIEHRDNDLQGRDVVANERSVRFNLSFNTCSDPALAFVRESFQECRKSHKACNSSSEDASQEHIRPSRLLDVGREENDLVTLRTTELLEDYEYLCLSHCWGGTIPLSLSIETHQMLSRGIPVTQLPRTFEDAVSITRRLRFQYLWIDSLCIFQDNLDDWAAEANRMRHIYAGAVITLAATAAENSNTGLRFDRLPRLATPRLIEVNFDASAPWLKGHAQLVLKGMYLCDVVRLATYCIELAPLNKRAWLFWECYELSACETYPKGLPDSAQSEWSENGTKLKDTLRLLKLSRHVAPSEDSALPSPSLGLDDEVYLRWCEFRITYTRGRLTYDSDKLVALRGIAEQISGLSGDELVAGLWRSRLIQELCWFNDHEPKQVCPLPIWRAPTWSWACSNSTIWRSNQTSYHGRHAGQVLQTELVSIDYLEKISGELEHALINIKCKPLPAILDVTCEYENGECYFVGCLEFVEHVNRTMETRTERLRLDSKYALNMDDQHDCDHELVYVILIQQCLHQDESRKWQDNDGDSEEDSDDGSVESPYAHPSTRSSLEGLVLKMQEERSKQYRRIGLFEFNSGSSGVTTIRDVISLHQAAEMEIITLV